MQLTVEFVRDVCGVCAFIVLMRVWGDYTYGKSWSYVERVLVSSLYAAFNAYCFFSEFRSSEIVSQLPPGRLLVLQAKTELGYYTAYGAIEILKMRKNGRSQPRMMVAHHVLALIAIGAAHAADLHQCICAMLFAFTVSTPPLAVATAQKRLLGETRGRTAFLVFAAMFVAFRICFVPYLMRFTIVDWRRVAEATGQLATFWTLNGLLTVIYAMQWVWLRRILVVVAE